LLKRKELSSLLSDFNELFSFLCPLSSFPAGFSFSRPRLSIEDARSSVVPLAGEVVVFYPRRDGRTAPELMIFGAPAYFSLSFRPSLLFVFLRTVSRTCTGQVRGHREVVDTLRALGCNTLFSLLTVLLAHASLINFPVPFIRPSFASFLVVNSLMRLLNFRAISLPYLDRSVHQFVAAWSLFWRSV